MKSVYTPVLLAFGWNFPDFLLYFHPPQTSVRSRSGPGSLWWRFTVVDHPWSNNGGAKTRGTRAARQQKSVLSRRRLNAYCQMWTPTDYHMTTNRPIRARFTSGRLFLCLLDLTGTGPPYANKRYYNNQVIQRPRPQNILMALYETMIWSPSTGSWDHPRHL